MYIQIFEIFGGENLINFKADWLRNKDILQSSFFHISWFIWQHCIYQNADI